MITVYLSKRIFPQQWEFLATTRGICSRDGDDLQDYKERQIFMTLLNLQRLANFRTLKHWAMVISMAYYGWGVKDTVSHVTLFLGITVSRATRDSFFKTRTCLMDLVKVGWNKLKEMKVNKIRMVADQRTQLKRTTTKYIVDRVKTMKEALMSASIPVEQADVEESEWVTYMQELRLNYYK